MNAFLHRDLCPALEPAHRHIAPVCPHRTTPLILPAALTRKHLRTASDFTLTCVTPRSGASHRNAQNTTAHIQTA